MDLGQPPSQAISLKDLYFNTPAPQGMSARKPGVTERIEGAVRAAATKAGMSPHAANQLAHRTSNALNDLTPVGAATGAEQAVKDWKQGRKLSSLFEWATVALSALPDGGATAAKGLHAIIAPLYHGSPHKFEKFALEKIGTGEGAQAYGHGLYFAENPKVAAAYRDTSAGNLYDTGFHNVDAMLNGGAYMGDWARFAQDHPTIAKQIEVAGRHKPNGSAGHLYEVKLDANPEDFLNWDAPLGGQPAAAQRLARELDVSGRFGRPLSSFDPRGTDIASRAAVAPNGIRTGDYQRETLLNAGLPGIRYLDQGSRGAGQGTHNYVVFDPGLIEILNRY